MAKNPPANTGVVGWIPGSGRSSGEENVNPPSTFAWETHGQRILQGYSPRGHRGIGHASESKTTAKDDNLTT